MSQSVLDPEDIRTSKYIITHVFCPLQLPGRDDHNIHNDRSLVTAIATAARLYSDHVGQSNISQWHDILRMLENLRDVFQSGSLYKSLITSQFSSMNAGGKLSCLRSMPEAHNVKMFSYCLSEPKMRGLSSESRRTPQFSSRSRCPQWLRM